MSEVESSASPEARVRRVILPYALWPHSQLAALDAATLSALPSLRHLLSQTTCTSRTYTGNEAQPSLSMPHEHARAAQLGWPLVDGLLPWAAHAATQAGLAHPGDGSAWGFISLCHWQISHGLVTLTDPADLDLDDATDAALFATMQPFFAEDGLALHRHLPGVWWVQSPDLAAVPSASLERVMGDDVDPWLVGGEMTAQAPVQPMDPTHTAKWQRLQNEMQMLLYTHPANAGRRVPVNSFWLHGTGALPTSAALAPHVPPLTDVTQGREWQTACDALRRAHRLADPVAWVHAWQRLDALCLHIDADEWVLCGTHAIHTHRRSAALGSAWQGLKRTLSSWMGGASASDWRSVLGESAAPHAWSSSHRGRA